MKVQFRESFVRDLRTIRDDSLRSRLAAIIQSVEAARGSGEIASLKKLRGGGNYYRIRVGDYRVGLAMEDDTVTFVRFLHRRDIYRQFP